MPVSSEVSSRTYTGTGAVSVYPYTFIIYDQDHLVVTKKDTSGNETVLSLTTHYSVSGVKDPAGGNVTLVSPLESGYELLIERVLPHTQPTDLTVNGNAPLETLETMVNRAVMQVQQLKRAIDRAILSSKFESGVEFPAPEAGKALVWDALAANLENANLLDLSLISVSAYMKTVLDDANAAAARTTLGAAAPSDIPSISTANPQPPGTAAPGSTGDVADAGHIHDLPTLDYSKVTWLGSASLVLSGGSATSFTAIDCSGVVPAGATAVVVRCEGAAASQGTVELRNNGGALSAARVGYMTNTLTGDMGAQAICPCDANRYISYTVGAAADTVNIYVVGYIV